MKYQGTFMFLAVGGLTALLFACSSAGGGREVRIVATDAGCTPTSIQAQAKEKLTFVVVNEAKGDRELEGIEGTKLEEVLIPAGRTRKINYTTPDGASIQKLKCYIPGGPTTVIDVIVSPSSENEAVGSTVNVLLNEWRVTPSVSEVKAGKIRFVVTNEGGAIHELAVVSVAADGSKRELEEVEDLRPGATAQFVADLKPGAYELACLVAPGQSGSTVDHYQQGMHVPFRVN